MQRGRLVCNERIFPVIKISGSILHVRDGPLSNFAGRLDASWMKPPQIDERLNALRRALDIQWARLIVIVSWRSIFAEKRLDEIPVTFLQCPRVLCTPSGTDKRIQSLEHISGVERINPTVFRFYPVVPRPVRRLM